MWHCVVPDLQVESVLELDPPRLESLRLNALFLDVDCTLKGYRDPRAGPEIEAWLAGLRQAGIGLCLISNGRGQRIQRFAEGLSIPVVCQACKPLPFGCRIALRRTGSDPRHTAIVGDQLFADVLAGRLAGLTCILVRPIRPEEEPWFTRLKRPLERYVLKRINARQSGRTSGFRVQGSGDRVQDLQSTTTC